MARSSNNGGTARSVVGSVPLQPFNLQGHAIHGREHRAVVRLILRLSSSDHGLRPRCPRCYAASSFLV